MGIDEGEYQAEIVRLTQGVEALVDELSTVVSQRDEARYKEQVWREAYQTACMVLSQVIREPWEEMMDIELVTRIDKLEGVIMKMRAFDATKGPLSFGDAKE